MDDDAYKQRIREQCTFPTDWGITDLNPVGFEISAHDGEEMAERTIEVINSDTRTEVTFYHIDMPGRKAAGELDRGETDPEVIDVPSPVGRLVFDEPASEAAIDAVDELADRETLDRLAATRNFVESDSHLDVMAAIEQETAINPESISEAHNSV